MVIRCNTERSCVHFTQFPSMVRLAEQQYNLTIRILTTPTKYALPVPQLYLPLKDKMRLRHQYKGE